MSDFFLKDVKIHAMQIFDRKTNTYTVTSMEKGGPLMMSENLEEAKAKFQRTIGLAVAARNLLFFKGTKGASNAQKKHFLGHVKEKGIVYHEVFEV